MAVERSREQRLRDLQDCGYIGAVEGLAKSVCAPVFFRTLAGKVRQGSMTLLNSGQGFLGVTAGHVADAIAAEAGNLESCQVGGAVLDPTTLVARSLALDLASYRAEAEVVRASGHLAFPIRSWPLQAASDRDMVMFCGYPGYDRRESSGRYDVPFLWFAGLVQASPDSKLGFALNIKTSLCAGNDRIPDNADLGGCSGGPVFRLTEEAVGNGLRATFELVGVVSEYASAYELLIAHPVTDLNPDGGLAT